MFGRSKSRDRSRGKPVRPLAITAFSGLLYAFDNSAQTEATLASVLDKSTNARTLSVSGTTAARPRAFPRNWAQNGQGVLSFGNQSCYAQDQAGDALTYCTPLHQAGIAIVLRAQILSNGPIVTNWGGGTSNQNAFSIEYNDATGVVTVYVTSRTGGGTVHITAATSAGTVRLGDVFTLTFKHKVDKTWTLKIVREARDVGSSQQTYNHSGSYASTISTAAPDFGLTIGSYGGLASFGSSRIHSLAIMQIGSSTDAQITAWENALAARCNFAFLAYDSTQELLQGSGDFTDGTHWDTPGHTKVGAMMVALEQSIVTALGYVGTIKVGVIGDSRISGTPPTPSLANSCRAYAQTNATFTRSAVGPVDDGSGTASKNHFGLSARVMRSNSGGQVGHSQRSAHAASIDAYVGSGKSYNDTDVWSWCIGVNDIVGAARPFEYDNVDERLRTMEYCYAQQRTLARVPGFVVMNEPTTGSTTTGPAQRLIRAYNRELHAMVANARGQGFKVAFGDLNETTYHA